MSENSSVFTRSRRPPPVAVSAAGAWITDAEGRQYLDAAGGAIASLIGHGDPAVAAALSAQAETLEWAHASTFTTLPTEEYAAALAALVPMDEARVYPVSGGSEAIETALKMARAYHLARGEPDRSVVIARAVPSRSFRAASPTSVPRLVVGLVHRRSRPMAVRVAARARRGRRGAAPRWTRMRCRRTSRRRCRA